MENMNAVPGKLAMFSSHIVYKSGEYNQMQKQCISPDSEASTCPYKSFSYGRESKWVYTNLARLIPWFDDTCLGNVCFNFCMTQLSKNVPPINMAGLGHIQWLQTPDASSRALGYLFLAYDNEIWCIFAKLPTSLKNYDQLFDVAKSYPGQHNEKLSSQDCLKLFRLLFPLKSLFFLLCFHIYKRKILIVTQLGKSLDEQAQILLLLTKMWILLFSSTSWSAITLL